MTSGGWNRRSTEEIENIVNNLGYVLLNNYILNGQRKVIIQDETGYKYDVYLKGLKKHGISIIDKRNQFVLENISLWLNINKKEFVLCDDNKYNGREVKLLFRCLNIECNSLFSMDWHHILDNQGCPKCISSKGEKKIINYFSENKIEFIQEARFKDCKNVRLLPFDFYVEKFNLCIEYHGEQHYVPIDFAGRGSIWVKKQFKEIQKRDKIKEDYCYNNGINLLIIPHWEFNNIESILLEALSELEGSN